MASDVVLEGEVPPRADLKVRCPAAQAPYDSTGGTVHLVNTPGITPRNYQVVVGGVHANGVDVEIIPGDDRGLNTPDGLVEGHMLVASPFEQQLPRGHVYFLHD